MSKHTPGPWSAGTNKRYVVYAADKRPVARARRHPGNDGSADAHLIAAAPEMLEALRFCVSDMQWAENNYEGTNFQSAILKARAAIAKAEGGDS